MIFGIKEKIYNFDPYNVFLAIATNIPVLLMTGFVLQGHICTSEPFIFNSNNVMRVLHFYLRGPTKVLNLVLRNLQKPFDWIWTDS